MTKIIPVAKPGLKHAKYTTHKDIACTSPSVLSVDMKAKWEELAKSSPETIQCAIDNIKRSIYTLDIWKQYLKQVKSRKEAGNGSK